MDIFKKSNLTRAVQGFLAAAALSATNGPAISRAQEAISPAGITATSRFFGDELFKDLKQIAAIDNGEYRISDKRVSEIKSELSKIFGMKVDQIHAKAENAIIHDPELNRDYIIFTSNDKKYSFIITGEEAGKVIPSNLSFAKTSAPELVANKEPSISQSSNVWLKVFAAANKELVRVHPAFNGKWNIAADPLGISSKIPTASDQVAKLTKIDGYSLQAAAGFGETGVAVVNKLFADNGLDSRLKADSQTGIVAGVVEDIKFPFKVKGKPSEVRIDGADYKAVNKSDPIFKRSPLSSEPLVELETSNGVGVYLIKVSGLPEKPNAANILSLSQKLVADAKLAPELQQTHKPGVVFPEVNFHSKTEPAWLLGASPAGVSGYVVSKTVLETIFKLDVNGGESKTGAAILTTRGLGGPRPYYINEPFIVITFDKDNPETVLNATLVGPDAFIKK